MGRCWGRTHNFTRCQRCGDWRFFCHDHKWQPLIFAGSVVAFIGSVASIHSCHAGATKQDIRDSTSKILNNSREKLEQVYPLITFDSYKWAIPYGHLSCDNPAQGLVVYYQNKSTVPVIMEKGEMSFFLGEKPILTSEPKRKLYDNSEKFVATGERDSVFRTTPEFAPFYRNLRGMSSDPKLRVKLSVIYRSINTGKRYKYQTEITIVEDCSFPNDRRYLQGNDKIENLSP